MLRVLCEAWDSTALSPMGLGVSPACPRAENRQLAGREGWQLWVRMPCEFRHGFLHPAISCAATKSGALLRRADDDICPYVGLVLHTRLCEHIHMATNLALDDRLIEEARRVGRHKTKREAVSAALAEYVRRRKQLRILDIFGTVDFDPKYDYKAERRRKRR